MTNSSSQDHIFHVSEGSDSIAPGFYAAISRRQPDDDCGSDPERIHIVTVGDPSQPWTRSS